MTDPSLPEKFTIFQLLDGADIQQNGRIHNALWLRPIQSQWDSLTDGCSVQGVLVLTVSNLMTLY